MREVIGGLIGTGVEDVSDGWGCGEVVGGFIRTAVGEG